MNETLFLGHIFLVVGFALAALRLGKGALISFIALTAVLANLFVVKQTTLFGLTLTCSDVFAIGGMLSLNLLQEFFGKEEAKRAVKISFGALVFFALMAQIHLTYSPAAVDTTHDAFQLLLSPSPRIVLASMLTFFVVQQFDVRFFAFLKGPLPVRVSISLFSSQLLDTVLFSLLGLYGLVDSVWNIMVVSFLIKCLVILTSTPFTAWAKRVVRRELSV